MKKRNSIYEILDVLNTIKAHFPTENEIMKLAFGYDRNSSMEANKKYADMLRRGIANGLIGRIDNRIVACRSNIGKARFVYVLTKAGEAALDVKYYK